MAVIRVLDKHIAELIAAGEVVERPASVIKELLENAIDAGATQVTIAIEAGGVRLMEVSDNGTGIEHDYIETAFIRHATSKIQTEDDLNQIATLGFRGEALASIASVSRVEVLTKTQDDAHAVCFRIEGGDSLGGVPAARATGTTIRVRDLFYNTPARMKFLKKDASEGTFVADLVSHVALSHPEVSVKFIREGKVQYVTPGDGTLMGATYAVLGREFARDLIAVEETSGLYRVSGFISPAKNCRASRSMQYFYINGRYVKNRTMMAGLEAAYKGTLMHGKFPGAVLQMEMPVDLIDVNVHPAKTEVRFAYEKEVFNAVYGAVKGALSAEDGINRFLQFNTQTQPQACQSAQTNSSARTTVQSMPTMQGTQPIQSAYTSHETTATPKDDSQSGMPYPVDAQKEQAHKSTQTAPITAYTETVEVSEDAPFTTRVQMFNPFFEEKARGFAAAKVNESVLDILPQVQEDPQRVQDTTHVTNESNAPHVMPQETVATADNEPVVMQAQDDISMCKEQQFQSEDLSALQGEDTASSCAEQTSLLISEPVEPLRYVGEAFKTYIVAQREDTLCLIDKHAAHERILYEALADSYGNVASQMLLEPLIVNLSAVEKQGLLENLTLLEDAGISLDDFGGQSVLVRSVPSDVPVQDIENLVVELAVKLAAGSRDAISEKTQWVLHSLACRAAIKAGDKSDAKQLLYLAQEILSGAVPPFCPHGRPCVIVLTRKELEKQFGRIE